MLIWILDASLLTIAAMLGAAGLVLAVREGVRARLLAHLLSYAVGTLLGAAFLGLLSHALEHGAPKAILGPALSGIVLFFVLEKLVRWRHCHEGRCEAHAAAGPLVLVGDALHNFVDGVVIAAAFVTALPLGVATTLAVVAHELPQELGDLRSSSTPGIGRVTRWP
jgi:zinc and cadmium transporter